MKQLFTWFKRLLAGFLLLNALGVLLTFFLSRENTEETEEQEATENFTTDLREEYITSSSSLEENHTLFPCESDQHWVRHRVGWEDYQRKKHRADIEVDAQDACKAHDERESYPTHYYDGRNAAPYWGAVYASLVRIDQQALVKIYKEFEQKARKERPTRKLLAETIMTFIQHIPYVLIHEGTCEEDQAWGGFSVTYHNEGKECVPNVKYGLQSPTEFMYNFKGDCDTRAVLAYALLSYFGYDVVVLGCEVHAMLGIALPANGDYLRYKGKKYYFWETTNVGWQIGQVPPNYKPYHWKVYLPSQND
ncbi:MAG: hypothetical protein ACFB0B_13235 [Thermonemataceae bacterium]